MTSAFRIEALCRTSDVDGVLEVDRLSFPSPWTRAMYEEELRQPETSFVLVLRTADAPVAGYCSYRLVADELQINNVAVRPECRRLGAGRALVEAVLEHGRVAGARTALLEVRASNVAAQQLYASLDFVQVGVAAPLLRPSRRGRPGSGRDVRNLEADPVA